jgi:hypothetical protein
MPRSCAWECNKQSNFRFCGSYRFDRIGIRLVEFVVERLRRRGDAVEVIGQDGQPSMLDGMYRKYPLGEAPEHPPADQWSPDALIFVRNAG